MGTRCRPAGIHPSEELAVGLDIEIPGELGEWRTARIKQTKDKIVALDRNHALTGKTLLFDVKVLGVEPPEM